MRLLELLKNDKLTKKIIDEATAAEINYIDDQKREGSSLIFCMLGESNLELMEYLINNVKCDLNILGRSNMSILNILIHQKNIKIIKLLINNPRFKLINFRLRLPIIQAIDSKNEQIIKLLLTDKNLDVNIFDKTKGFSLPILMFELFSQKKEVMKLLLQNEKLETINNTQNILGYNLLHIAVQSDNTAITKLILKYTKIDVNCPTSDKAAKRTALHLAIAITNFDLVNLLLCNNTSNQCDLNVKDKLGRTPMHYAILTQDKRIINTLLKNIKLNLDIRDENGFTPLDYTINLNDNKLIHSIAKTIYKKKLFSKNEINEIINYPKEKIIFNIKYIKYKSIFIREFKELFKDYRFKKIFSSYENDEYDEHCKYVDKYINQYQDLLIITKNKDQNNEEFLKLLKRYQENLLKIQDCINKTTTIDQDKSNFQRKIIETKEKHMVKKPIADASLEQLAVQENFSAIDRFKKEDSENYFNSEQQEVEKRIFLKKDKQTPKFQQPKIRKITKNQDIASNIKKSEHKKITNITSETKLSEQENLSAIVEWEKWNTMQQKALNTSRPRKKTQSLDFINFFDELRESFVNLNSDELDAAKEWWIDTILELNLTETEIETKIIDKINHNDKKERKLTDVEFYLLNKIKKTKLNQEKQKNDNIFSIVILHRDNFRDKNGRPAISLGTTADNQELIIPGTTRKLDHYEAYHLKLNDINTYFYIKNILTVDETNIKGPWKVNERVECENETLLQMIDKYYIETNQAVVVADEMLASDLEQLKVRTGAFPKYTKKYQ